MYVRQSILIYRMYTIINLSFETPICFGEVWKKFEEKDVNNPVFKVMSLEGNEEYGLETAKILNSGEYVVRCNEDVMVVDSLWKRAWLLPLRKRTHLNDFVCQLYYTHAVQRHMIYLHSSLIDFKGRGLMFLGPSGIGKTTQAELWNQDKEALIINGDRVFVQETSEAFLGWGTPWHGSSPYCENTNVPVHAMIVLKQAPENSIRELTGFEKVTAVSNSVFYPRWLENGMELCLETLDHLLTKIPVYELSCRPDEDAVKLTEETVFGSN